VEAHVMASLNAVLEVLYLLRGQPAQGPCHRQGRGRAPARDPAVAFDSAMATWWTSSVGRRLVSTR
jgi:hypothetical protein